MRNERSIFQQLDHVSLPSSCTGARTGARTGAKICAPYSVMLIKLYYHRSRHTLQLVQLMLRGKAIASAQRFSWKAIDILRQKTPAAMSPSLKRATHQLIIISETRRKVVSGPSRIATSHRQLGLGVHQQIRSFASQDRRGLLQTGDRTPHTTAAYLARSHPVSCQAEGGAQRPET